MVKVKVSIITVPLADGVSFNHPMVKVKAAFMIFISIRYFQFQPPYGES